MEFSGLELGDHHGKLEGGETPLLISRSCLSTERDDQK